jgi:acyl-coenzyme A thioesterase PaaI-like protein
MKSDAGGPRVWTERQCKWRLNLYPPFLLNRIRVQEIGPGFLTCRVLVHRSILTRNLQGSTFGGTLYSAADPIYALMYWQIFAHRGERVQAWLRSATVRYLKPASGRVSFEFVLTDDDVERACAALAQHGRYAHTHRADAVNSDGQVCAVVDTEVYIRRPRSGKKGVSAF